MNTESLEHIDRQQLIALAYRMTGEVTTSEDIVHDLLADWVSRPRPAIQNVAAYLAKAVTNRCLTYLTGIKRQRDLYKGSWLPEPMVNDPFRSIDTAIDLSYGFAVVLGKLTPSERAVFLLRESFDIDYQELSELLGLAQANCRQLYHRAQQRLASTKKRFRVNDSQQQALLSAFTQAIQAGDVSAFTQFLKQDIILHADGGGKAAAPLHPLVGIRAVVSFLQGLIRKGFVTYGIKPVDVNGTVGFLLFTRPSSQLDTVMIVELDEEQIDTIYLVRNPDKLRHVADVP